MIFGICENMRTYHYCFFHDNTIHTAVVGASHGLHEIPVDRLRPRAISLDILGGFRVPKSRWWKSLKHSRSPLRRFATVASSHRPGSDVRPAMKKVLRQKSHWIKLGQKNCENDETTEEVQASSDFEKTIWSKSIILEQTDRTLGLRKREEASRSVWRVRLPLTALHIFRFHSFLIFLHPHGFRKSQILLWLFGGFKSISQDAHLIFTLALGPSFICPSSMN